MDAPTGIRTSFDSYCGIDDHNWAEFPLFSVTKSNDRLRQTLITEHLSQHKLIPDAKINRQQKIVGSDEYGLPTDADGDVLLALLSLLGGKELLHRIHGHRIYFCRKELIQFMKWPLDGKSYRRLDQALHTWTTTSIHYSNWWDNENEAYCERAYNILAEFKTIKSSKRQSEAEEGLSFVEFTGAFVKAWTGGWPKTIDLDTYYNLNNPTAKVLYRFLDKRARIGVARHFDLRNLVTQHIGLKGTDPLGRPLLLSKLRYRLEKAIKELIKIGFLEDKPISEMYGQAKGGKQQITFFRTEINSQVAIQEDPLLEELLILGVWDNAARKLLSDPTISKETIREKIELARWKITNPDETAPRNMGSWLVSAIKDDFPLPANFETAADRAKRLAKENEIKRGRAVEKEKARQAKEELEEKEAKESAQKWEKVNSFKDTLSSQKRMELDELILNSVEKYNRPYVLKYLKNPTDGNGFGAVFYRDAIIAHIDKATK